MNVWEWILHIDTELFSFIHNSASHPGIDWLMKLLREAFTWVPLYAFMIYWVVRFGRHQAWQFILLTLVTFAITDYTAASILKPWIARTRPCYEPELQPIIRGLVGCGGPYTLPSNHAANHFGLAAFWFPGVSMIRAQKWWWLWIWAFVIGYAQVYVGKHYPLDIVAGAAFGMVVGFTAARVFRVWCFPAKGPRLVSVS